MSSTVCGDIRKSKANDVYQCQTRAGFFFARRFQGTSIDQPHSERQILIHQHSLNWKTCIVSEQCRMQLSISAALIDVGK